MATAVLEEIAAGTRVCCSGCGKEFTTELPAALQKDLKTAHGDISAASAGGAARSPDRCANGASGAKIPWKPLPPLSVKSRPLSMQSWWRNFQRRSFPASMS
jgi:hypothetical protein